VSAAAASLAVRPSLIRMPPSLLDERGSRNDPGTVAREYATHHTFVLALLVTVAQTVLAAAPLDLLPV